MKNIDKAKRENIRVDNLKKTSDIGTNKAKELNK